MLVKLQKRTVILSQIVGYALTMFVGVTIILLTTGDLKWWLFGLFCIFAFLGKLYIKNKNSKSEDIIL